MANRKAREDRLKVLTREIETARSAVGSTQKRLVTLEKERIALVTLLSEDTNGPMVISAHAVLRYLERVTGLGDYITEAITEMRRHEPSIKAGAHKITCNGATLIIKDKTIVTVE